MTHSIKFPLPLNIHIGFVVVSVILLFLCYKRKKHLYELLLLIGVASTMLVYVTDTKPMFYILGLEEIILFIWACVDMHKVTKAEEAAEKAKAAAKEAETNEPAEELIPGLSDESIDKDSDDNGGEKQ